MMDETTRKDLVRKCCLIFINLPIGKNSYNDSPIIGNKTLAQVIVNRVESISKKPDEFKFMVDTIVKMLKDTNGKTIEKIKVNVNNKYLVESGIFDSNGNMIKKWKKD